MADNPARMGITFDSDDLPTRLTTIPLEDGGAEVSVSVHGCGVYRRLTRDQALQLAGWLLQNGLPDDDADPSFTDADFMAALDSEATAFVLSKPALRRLVGYSRALADVRAYAVDRWYADIVRLIDGTDDQ